MHTRLNPNHIPFSWKILLSGYTPEYVYEQGRMNTDLPFAELQRRSHINEVALQADQAPDFSRRIRAHLLSPCISVSRASSRFRATALVCNWFSQILIEALVSLLDLISIFGLFFNYMPLLGLLPQIQFEIRSFARTIFISFIIYLQLRGMIL